MSWLSSREACSLHSVLAEWISMGLESRVGWHLVPHGGPGFGGILEILVSGSSAKYRSQFVHLLASPDC